MIYDTSTTKNNIVNVLNMSVAHLEVLSGFFQDLYSIGADHLYSTEKLQFTETSVVFVFNNSNNKNFTYHFTLHSMFFWLLPIKYTNKVE